MFPERRHRRIESALYLRLGIIAFIVLIISAATLRGLVSPPSLMGVAIVIFGHLALVAIAVALARFGGR